MTQVALAVSRSIEERLVGELVRAGHSVVARCDDARELQSILRDDLCDIALVEAAGIFLSTAVLEASDAAGVRVIGLVASDAGRRLAASVGLSETIGADAEWRNIEAMFDGPVPNSAPDARVTSGRVIAVWGPAGSPGRTSLAIAIAAELAAAGASVALADVDTHSGSIAPALGLLDESPGFAAACRLAGASSLTLSELERIGQRYLSGHGSFWVLTGIGRASRWPELSADRVTATLRQCRGWVDYTVVDTGFSLENDEEISSDVFAPRRNAATVAALAEADQVIAVGSADPVGLARFLRAHVDLLETIETDQVSVVMNKVRASAIGAHPGVQVIQTLRRFGGIINPVIVPHDQNAFDAAVLTGRTLRDTAMRSSARQAIGQFVHTHILPTSDGPAPTRRSLRLATR